jgi:heme-degrading monooxygenase HmoA
MIRHAAIFKLKHARGSDEEKDFLDAIRELKAIPGVERFELARETSPKNAYDFAVSMYFADEAAYQAYNVHPAHVAFVEGRWIPEMASFMEHDTVELA